MEENREKILDVKDYSISLYRDRQKINIISHLNFHVYKGETVGIVGESGCGKSITAQSIMRLVRGKKDTPGEILFRGEDLLKKTKKQMRAIRGDQISMIFQEPMTSLNPTFTVGTQLMEVFRIHENCSKKEAWNRSVEMLKMVNIAEPEKRMKCYPHELSGGMRQRVMIAMALSCKPYLMIADEPTTALDVTIQAQILTLMKQLEQETGTAIMLITHDLGVVAEVCSRAIILYCGRVMEETPVSMLFKDPLHPYTAGLIRSLPELGKHKSLYMIPGNVPSTGKYPQGCTFHPRCEYCTEQCCSEEPPETRLPDGRRVRCWRYCNGKEEKE